jgi:hypothetical protein
VLIGILNNAPTVKFACKVTSLLASSNTALLAGNVQNTSFVPPVKVTMLSELELVKIVVLVKTVPPALSVPNPTSHS